MNHFHPVLERLDDRVLPSWLVFAEISATFLDDIRETIRIEKDRVDDDQSQVQF